MPVLKTAQIFINFTAEHGIKPDKDRVCLDFWDDGGAGPYWGTEVAGNRTFIPSSPEAAMKEGLVVFWASYMAAKESAEYKSYSIFGKGPSPVKLQESSISSDLIEEVIKSLTAFGVKVEAKRGSFIALPHTDQDATLGSIRVSLVEDFSKAL